MFSAVSYLIPNKARLRASPVLFVFFIDPFKAKEKFPGLQKY